MSASTSTDDSKKKTKPAKASVAHPSSPRFDLPGSAVGFVESSTVVPLVSIVLSLRSGALADPEGKDGLSRLTARMIRRGCKGMTSSEIESAVDRLGGEIGFDVGPSTISLHAQVIRRNLQPFVDLLAKIIGTPTFDQEELDRLKRETVAELIDARDNDRALAGLAFRRAMFPGHPYSRTAAGRPASVEKLTREEVLATYAKRFVQSDIVIGFAGAITMDEAKTLGAQLVRAVPEGPHVENELPEPQHPVGRKLFFVDKPERTQTQILIGTLGTHARDPDHWPLVAATAVFGGTFTSRMMREIRSKRGWSYGTSARLSIERKRHAFTMGAFPAAADCAPCVSLELKLLEDFTKDGITPRELAFIKNYLIRSHAFEIDTAPKRLGQALEAELLDLPPDYHTRYLDHVHAVTLESANAAVASRLTAKDLVVVVVGTASEILDPVTKAIPDLVEHVVIPFDLD
ncbi:MAG: Zinc protease [Myxococcaceae bacterium]|jgi:zinc protease|nr:Zinc protease [Myxococcaceae bacterium]